jgi:serine/threonine-protein kinase
MPGPISFGRYVLLEKLASGGMAEIFLAKAVGEAGFEKACVIKRVLPHLASSPSFVEMFLDEAHLAAKLNHPGIVQIFDLGRQDEDYFLAMEYLAGEDLYAIAKLSASVGRAMPLDVATRIAACAAEALHYAHEAAGADGRALGIVHRDISPSNLFVTYQGAVKVLDFGIARAEQRLQQTGVGRVRGKAAYMSPEQARGLQVDRRADVWALGVCLHELLTGQRLFARDSNSLTLEAVGAGPIPSPRVARPDVPEELERAVMTALARDPEARFATAEALRAALDRFLAERTYVPQMVLLGQFMRDLFGEERAQARLRLATAPAMHPSTGAGTVELPVAQEQSAPTVSSASTQEPTVADRPGRVSSPKAEAASLRSPPPARRWTGWAVVGAVVAVVAGWVLFRPRAAPEATVEPSVRVPAAVPSALELRTEAPLDAPAPEAPAPVVVAAPVDVPRVAKPRPPERPRAQFALLSVESNPAANASLDGARLGGTPVSRAKVPAGSHLLKLENPALGLARVERITLRAGEEKVHRVSFQKGKINVMVDPWADVWLDGAKVGQTPLAAREVWEGRHRLRLVGPQGEKTVTVEVGAGQTVVVREKLP